MLDLKTLKKPATPGEAVRYLLETEGTGLYVAGGTIVVPTASPSLDYLVDLGGLGLEYIRTAGRPEESAGAGTDTEAIGGDTALVLGAMTRIADLVESAELSGPALGAIREAARTIGTHTVRNRATVGGNIAAAHYPSDLPPVFLALGAAVVLHDAAGLREVSLADMFQKRAEVYRRGDLIVEVKIPAPPAGLRCAFEKTGRMKVDVAIVSCAASLVVENDRVALARIVLGGTGARPVVVEPAASFLLGKTPSPDVFERAGSIVSESVSPREDHRASSAYRKKVAAVVTRRALERAAGPSSK